jgi:hypothetical protein
MSRRSKTKRGHKVADVSSDRWLVLGVCVFLAAITWLVFGQTRGFQFVNFADTTYVLENPVVAREVKLDGIASAFTHFQGANWHPLTWISHMLDAQLYGLNAGRHLGPAPARQMIRP